jgi:hypothetical protein
LFQEMVVVIDCSDDILLTVDNSAAKE